VRCRLSLLALALSVGTAVADHGDAKGRASLLPGLGNRTHKVTTTSPDAQKFFDQGLTLCWAFNHPEAIRSFERAAKFDPDCAMAYWGIAFAHGSNINMPMEERAGPKALAALKQAQALAAKAAPPEQAYIKALGARYVEANPKDRAHLDQVFADAMREVVKAYPDDSDAAVLFAEAIMDTMPWAYWTADGKPKPATVEMIDVLERVMKRDPDHPGALHYYIHAVENSPTPERGLPAAHRLRDLLPGAGHLVHMPSHIYLRVGMYHEASLCNERAVAVDAAYISKYGVTGIYAGMYYPHNWHFLWYSTGMEGRSADSVRAARAAAAIPTDEVAKAMPEAQWVKATPALALARFGLWDDVLREPAPAEGLTFVKAVTHYTRGLAFVRRNNREQAAAELAELDKIAADPELKKITVATFPGEAVVKVYQTVLTAEVAGTPDALRTGLESAVKLQDELPYMEPPFFYMPLRQRLGAALLEAGRVADAEAVYREDLKRNPENGWSLYGLLQCLRAAGRHTDAAAVERRFRDAWKYADTTLTAGAF
jgi:tetratricopeptide (TPR) repeat protein